MTFSAISTENEKKKSFDVKRWFTICLFGKRFDSLSSCSSHRRTLIPDLLLGLIFVVVTGSIKHWPSRLFALNPIVQCTLHEYFFFYKNIALISI